MHRKGCINYTFSKHPKNLLARIFVFCNSIFGGRLVIDCLATFFSRYYFVLILFYKLKRQGISKMALELAYLCYGHPKYHPFSNFFQLRNLSFCLIGASNRGTEIFKKMALLDQNKNVLVLF